MTEQELREWRNLILRREGTSVETERDALDDEMDAYWYKATSEQRERMVAFIVALDRITDGLEGK